MDDPMICRAFGKRVHSLRLQMRISQEELADASDIHRNYCSDIERGKRNPSLIVIYHIANALDLSMHVLLDENFETLVPPETRASIFVSSN